MNAIDCPGVKMSGEQARREFVQWRSEWVAGDVLHVGECEGTHSFCGKPVGQRQTNDLWEPNDSGNICLCILMLRAHAGAFEDQAICPRCAPFVAAWTPYEERLRPTLGYRHG